MRSMRDRELIAHDLCLEMAAHLDGKEWGADDVQILADMLTRGGYEIRDPDEVPHDAGYHDPGEEAAECTACNPPPPSPEVQRRKAWELVRRGLAYFREAQRLLREGGARNAWKRVKAAGKSVEGAERHAYGKYTRVRA